MSIMQIIYFLIFQVIWLIAAMMFFGVDCFFPILTSYFVTFFYLKFTLDD